MREQYERAETLLKEHMQELNSLAAFLYDHETITGEEFMGLLEQFKPVEAVDPVEEDRV